MREKSDEITHLKTREMSLIDKSDTLEKGQIMNIIYYMWFKYLILWSLELQTQAYKKVSIATRQGNLWYIIKTVDKVSSVIFEIFVFRVTRFSDIVDDWKESIISKNTTDHWFGKETWTHIYHFVRSIY